MTERLQIEITGDLPDAGKYSILASAEAHAKEFAKALESKHPDVKLTVSVKPVRPGKKGTRNTNMPAPGDLPVVAATASKDAADPAPSLGDGHTRQGLGHASRAAE